MIPYHDFQARVECSSASVSICQWIFSFCASLVTGEAAAALALKAANYDGNGYPWNPIWPEHCWPMLPWTPARRAPLILVLEVEGDWSGGKRVAIDYQAGCWGGGGVLTGATRPEVGVISLSQRLLSVLRVWGTSLIIRLPFSQSSGGRHFEFIGRRLAILAVVWVSWFFFNLTGSLASEQSIATLNVLS